MQLYTVIVFGLFEKLSTKQNKKWGRVIFSTNQKQNIFVRFKCFCQLAELTSQIKVS